MANLDMKVEWAESVCDEHLLSLEPDASYAMEDCAVPKQIQAKLSFAGFKTMSQLRGLGDSRAEIKSMLAESLGINVTDLMNRASVASVQALWDSATAHFTKRLALRLRTGSEVIQES